MEDCVLLCNNNNHKAMSAVSIVINGYLSVPLPDSTDMGKGIVIRSPILRNDFTMKEQLGFIAIIVLKRTTLMNSLQCTLESRHPHMQSLAIKMR